MPYLSSIIPLSLPKIGRPCISRFTATCHSITHATGDKHSSYPALSCEQSFRELSIHGVQRMECSAGYYFYIPLILGLPNSRMNSAASASFAMLLALIPLAAAQSGAWGQCTPSVHNVLSFVYVYTFEGGGIGWTGPTVSSWRTSSMFLSY